MKTTPTLIRSVLLAAMAFAIAGSLQLRADPHFAVYTHDDHGYWDDHHVHHDWVTYHNERGYWDDRGGSRIWIAVP